jgi:hypothetical protein
MQNINSLLGEDGEILEKLRTTTENSKIKNIICEKVRETFSDSFLNVDVMNGYLPGEYVNGIRWFSKK